MPNKAGVVFTAKSVDRILEEGGTSSWRLDRNHARHCTNAVCTRNAHADWVEGTEAQRPLTFRCCLFTRLVGRYILRASSSDHRGSVSISALKMPKIRRLHRRSARPH